MTLPPQRRPVRLFALPIFVSAFFFIHCAPAQQIDEGSVIRRIDDAVKHRLANLKSYTVTEHYSVFRNNDQSHPAAEMTVETTYRAESGKSYRIVSESGSAFIRNFVFNTLLENEKHINQPGVRETAWITSANYEMKLKFPTPQRLNGRDCFVLNLFPRRKAPFLVDGSLWVDAKDFSIVQIEGVSSKSPSIWTGPTQMFRQYTELDGIPEATHARAVSNSGFIGRTIVTIDYLDYHLQLRSPEHAAELRGTGQLASSHIGR